MNRNYYLFGILFLVSNTFAIGQPTYTTTRYERLTHVCEYFIELDSCNGALKYVDELLKNKDAYGTNLTNAGKILMSCGKWKAAESVVSKSASQGFGISHFIAYCERKGINPPEAFFEKYKERARKAQDERQKKEYSKCNMMVLIQTQQMDAIDRVGYAYEYDGAEIFGKATLAFIDTVVNFNRLKVLMSKGVPTQTEATWGGIFSLYGVLVHQTAYLNSYQHIVNQGWIDTLYQRKTFVTPHYYAYFHEHHVLNMENRGLPNKGYLYGTHPVYRGDEMVYDNIVEPQKLDERRLAIGLPPFAYASDRAKLGIRLPTWYKCKYTIDDYINGKIPTK